MNLLSDAFYRDLATLLSIRSIGGEEPPVPGAPLGAGIRDAITAFLKIAGGMGFRTKLLDGVCGYAEFGTKGPLIGILAHLDTVPADGDWNYPPFSLTIKDGRAYGRGAVDDKGPALVALYAMKAVMDEGAPLPCRIRLIVGGDEESGKNRCLARYKKTEEIPAMCCSPDADFPLIFAEKGILRVAIEGDFTDDRLALSAGTLINVVPAHADAVYAGRSFAAEGQSAHSMAPELGENALLKLGESMRHSGIDHPFLNLLSIASVEGFSIAFSDAASGVLTINPSIAKVDSGHGKLLCDIRMPVSCQKDEVIRSITEAVAPLSFLVSETHFAPPLYVREDSPLCTALLRAYREVTGDNSPPVATGGGTYAREFENAVAFGVQFPGEKPVFHKENEYFALNSMEKTFSIYKKAILYLCEAANH